MYGTVRRAVNYCGRYENYGKQKHLVVTIDRKKCPQPTIPRDAPCIRYHCSCKYPFNAEISDTVAIQIAIRNMFPTRFNSLDAVFLEDQTFCAVL